VGIVTPLQGGSLSEYCLNVWYWKTTTLWLPGGEKSWRIWRYLIRFHRIHEHGIDRRKDGHTDTARRHRPRLCIASRGKMRSRPNRGIIMIVNTALRLSDLCPWETSLTVRSGHNAAQTWWQCRFFQVMEKWSRNVKERLGYFVRRERILTRITSPEATGAHARLNDIKPRRQSWRQSGVTSH